MGQFVIPGWRYPFSVVCGHEGPSSLLQYTRLALCPSIRVGAQYTPRQDGMLAAFDEGMWYALVDHVAAESAGNLKFVFKSGVEKTLQYL